MKKIGIIGSGFSSLAAAGVLSHKGYEVHVFEKNECVGGRARQFKEGGFTFDMGPSWYWMPEVFEKYFNRFGKKTSDFYELLRLDPSYRVYFGKEDLVDIPADFEALVQLFERIEPGSGAHLETFIREAEYKYEVGMQEFVWKPSLSVTEFIDLRILKSLFKLQMFSSIAGQIDKLFQSEKLRNILKFPVLFLGATPENTPALYSLMNYADLKLGTWYPLGGMYKIVEAFESIALEGGVKFHTSTEVHKIVFDGESATGLDTNKGMFEFDVIISGADYEHTEQRLIPPNLRIYNKKYWNDRVMAPSSLLFYLGLNTRLDGVKHHNLFFDKPFAAHAEEIYTKPSWPKEPLFYFSCPSKTDQNIAPEGSENVFLLMPLAPDLKDSQELREKYFQMMCDRILEITDQDIRGHIIYKRSYAMQDFKADYHAFKGNAYGLANTLWQTAFLKPKIQHKKLKNMYFTGQLTSPGPGVPPSIISGQVVADMIINQKK